MNFCIWFLGQCNDPAFLGRFVIGDEAKFSLNGSTNTKNLVFYAPKEHPPAQNYNVPESREKLTVFIGLCGEGTLIGLYFFAGNVTGQTYLEMLNQMVIPELALNHWLDFNQLWWAQDGAPAHRSRAVQDCLGEIFDDRIICHGRNPELPPRSLDLTPMDFFCGII